MCRLKPPCAVPQAGSVPLAVHSVLSSAQAWSRGACWVLVSSESAENPASGRSSATPCDDAIASCPAREQPASGGSCCFVEAAGTSRLPVDYCCCVVVCCFAGGLHMEMERCITPVVAGCLRFEILSRCQEIHCTSGSRSECITGCRLAWHEDRLNQSVCSGARKRSFQAKCGIPCLQGFKYNAVPQMHHGCRNGKLNLECRPNWSSTHQLSNLAFPVYASLRKVHEVDGEYKTQAKHNDYVHGR